MRLHAALLALAVLPACADEYNTPLPLAPTYQATTIHYNATVTPLPAPAPTSASTAPTSAPSIALEPWRPRRTDAAHVLVYQTTHLDRPAEVVGVVDAHEEMGHHEDALKELREKASALGADAIVGVEFHHGEGAGEPTHLSGLAVRFIGNAS